MSQRILLIGGIVGIVLISYYVVLASPQNINLVFNPKQITPVSPLYPIKVSREKLQSLFVFGQIDQANWNLTLAEKRLTEATILRDHNLLSLSMIQLNLAKSYQSKANDLIMALKETTDTVYLESKLNYNQELLHQLE